MRVRKRKGAEEHLENNPHYVILNPEEAKGRWREVFGNDNPIHIEVGSGKGAFITGMALQNPDINYIGIDIQVSVLSYALDKVLDSQAPNVRLLLVDGSDLTNYIADGEIDLMYLNFSDPWPKKPVIFRPQYKCGEARGHLLLYELGILVVGKIARFHKRRHSDRQASDLSRPQHLESM